MTRPLVIVDVETTSRISPWLPHGRRIWQVAALTIPDGFAGLAAAATGPRRLTETGPDGHGGRSDTRQMATLTDVDLSTADPDALAMNGYWTGRFASLPTGWESMTYDSGPLAHAATAAATLHPATRGAVIAGLNVGFDAASLDHLLWTEGYPPAWHYTPLDIKSYAVGVLGPEYVDAGSNTIAAALGVGPDRFDRHTAAGDVEFAAAILAAATDRRRAP